MSRWKASRRSSSRSSPAPCATSKAWRWCWSSSTPRSPFRSPSMRWSSSGAASRTPVLLGSSSPTKRCSSATSAYRLRISARLDHALALAAVVAPLDDLALERRDLELELALAAPAGGVLVLEIAVRHRLGVRQAQLVEHRIYVRVIDALADLVVHHLLECVVLRRCDATGERQRQQNRDCPCFQYAWARTTSVLASTRNGSAPPAAVRRSATLSITWSMFAPLFSISVERGVPRICPVAKVRALGQSTLIFTRSTSMLRKRAPSSRPRIASSSLKLYGILEKSISASPGKSSCRTALAACACGLISRRSHALKRSVPPSISTRRISAKSFGFSGTNITPSEQTTAPKVSSLNGSAAASARRQSILPFTLFRA